MINKLSAKDYSSILRYFQKNYAKTFPSNPNPVPLAAGIHKDILAIKNLPFSKAKIDKFLNNYTKKKIYKKNLIIGKNRINLQGNVSGSVTEEQLKIND